MSDLLQEMVLLSTYRDAACLYCKTDPANKQRLSDIMTYRANIDYEFMMCETEEEN